MKKLMMLAALLAMLVVAAVPAIAQVGQENEQEVESGDAGQGIEITGGGDNSNACQNVQGINNTGNAVNNTSILQYANDGAGAGVGGGNFEIEPETAIECTSTVNQAASAAA